MRTMSANVAYDTALVHDHTLRVHSKSLHLAGLRIQSTDMLTLVLVGSSTTRRVARGDGAEGWVYTPRGYAAKAITDEDPKNEEEVA